MVPDASQAAKNLSPVEHECRLEDHRLMARTAAVRAPLGHPAFRRLWLGLSFSYLGDQFTIIALLWFVLQLTGSGAAVGLVILCFDLPGVVTGAILGRLLDRYQPRLVMGLDNLARAALIATIPTLYALGSLHLWHVFVLVLLAGALSPATTAGVRAFVPHLVDDAALDRANALTGTSLQFSYLAGPVAAGFAVARLGGPWALFIDAASFLLMGLLMLTLPTITRQRRVARHVSQQVATDRWLGFGALFSLRYVPALTLLSLVFFFSYGPLEAALPVYSGQTLHANADGYGLLWTGFGVGAFAGVLTLTRLSHRWRPSIALPMIAVLWGALLLPLFFIRQLPLAMLFLGVAGASWAPYTPMETTLLQRLVPVEIRGQVFGARHSLLVAASPLGAALGGVLLQYLSAPLVIAISGLACILAGLGGLVSPSLRQLQRESP
jgi:predicted MFS family arabinose efflux permease